MMYITVRVPDNTSRLFYAECDNCCEMESKPVTMGMIVKVEQEVDVNDIMVPMAQGDRMPEEKP